MEIAVGVIVGLVLGMTGAGGAVFAVPLFILLLGFSPSEATGTSLGVVSISAMVGVITRLGQKKICWVTAGAMIAGGAVLAPVGRWIASQLNETLLLIGFSLLALFIAVRMLKQARADKKVKTKATAAVKTAESKAISWPVLVGAGAATGLLSGLFGVGGGFFVVPILTLFAKMEMKRAAATSLLVISVVSTVGFGSNLYMQPMEDWSMLLEIAAGSVVGMVFGSLFAHRISGPKLQEVFAVCVVGLMSLSLVQALT